MTASTERAMPLTLGEALRMYLVPLLIGVGILGVAYQQTVWAMVRDWYFDDNASHGFLIPVISGYIIWTKRALLARAPVSSSRVGLAVAAAAAVMLVAGWLASELFTMRFSLVLALCGCVLYWFGKDVFSLLATPLLFLTFMIPIPAIVYDAIAFPLKLLVSRISVDALKAMGLMVLREGNIIMFPNVTLEVVDACSGLRSLTSLLALSAAYSLIFCTKPWQRIVLTVSAVPIAVATNTLRVIGTGLLARHIGSAAAEGFFHEFTGLAIFGVALAMVFGLHQVLRRIGR